MDDYFHDDKSYRTDMTDVDAQGLKPLVKVGSPFQGYDFGIPPGWLDAGLDFPTGITFETLFTK